MADASTSLLSDNPFEASAGLVNDKPDNMLKYMLKVSGCSPEKMHKPRFPIHNPELPFCLFNDKPEFPAGVLVDKIDFSSGYKSTAGKSDFEACLGLEGKDDDQSLIAIGEEAESSDV